MHEAHIKADQRGLILGLAWVTALLASDLLEIIADAATGAIPGWLAWIKLGGVLVVLGLCLAWPRLQALRPFAAVMVVFLLALRLTSWIQALPEWQAAFQAENASFFLGYTRFYLTDLLLSAVMLLALWLIFRRREAFFLRVGDLKAPIEPVRWLGIKRGKSWAVFGWIFGVCAMAGVAIPTLLGLRLDGAILARALPLVPACLLFAGINAFTEETYYRLPFLAAMPGVVGRGQAMLMQMAVFGLAHWRVGSPPGLVGFALTAFLAFLMGKSILETKGIGWAWLIHFLPDVVVFFSYAVMWVG